MIGDRFVIVDSLTFRCMYAGVDIDSSSADAALNIVDVAVIVTPSSVDAAAVAIVTSSRSRNLRR